MHGPRSSPRRAVTGRQLHSISGAAVAAYSRCRSRFASCISASNACRRPRPQSCFRRARCLPLTAGFRLDALRSRLLSGPCCCGSASPSGSGSYWPPDELARQDGAARLHRIAQQHSRGDHGRERNAARRASAFVSVSCPRFLWTARSRLMNEENARMDVAVGAMGERGRAPSPLPNRSSPIPSGTPHSAWIIGRLANYVVTGR